MFTFTFVYTLHKHTESSCIPIRWNPCAPSNITDCISDPWYNFLYNQIKLHSFPQKIGKEVQSSLASANAIAAEAISSMRTVKSFANEEGERLAYKTKLDRTYHFRKKEAMAYAIFKILSYVSFSISPTSNSIILSKTKNPKQIHCSNQE